MRRAASASGFCVGYPSRSACQDRSGSTSAHTSWAGSPLDSSGYRLSRGMPLFVLSALTGAPAM